MERPITNFLQDALREIDPKKKVRKTVGSVLIGSLVGQYLGGRLLLCDLLHQTLDPASISSNLRTD